MSDCREAFVGIDVAKLKNAIAIAEAGREGEVRFFGEVEASDQSMRRIIQRIVGRFDRVHFCYGAGPTGYGLLEQQDHDTKYLSDSGCQLNSDLNTSSP